MLVDIHPSPQHKVVKFEESGTWRDIGLVERVSSIFSDIDSSEKVLERTLESGLFAQDSSETYERVDYVESVNDWDEYLQHSKTAGFSGDREALSRALRRLDRGEECLRVHTEFRVASYSKIAQA